MVTLLGDNVIQAEVAFKHVKSPGGTYRGTAHPDVQWKLQQLQVFKAVSIVFNLPLGFGKSYYSSHFHSL